MAVIGTFKLIKSGGWEGTIRTLMINEKIRLVPNDNRTSTDAPTFRIMLGWSKIGDAWEAETDSLPPKAYLSLRIDDPAFPAPMRAALFPDEDATTARLVWSRLSESGRDGNYNRGARHAS